MTSPSLSQVHSIFSLSISPSLSPLLRSLVSLPLTILPVSLSLTFSLHPLLSPFPLVPHRNIIHRHSRSLLLSSLTHWREYSSRLAVQDRALISLYLRKQLHQKQVWFTRWVSYVLQRRWENRDRKDERYKAHIAHKHIQRKRMERYFRLWYKIHERQTKGRMTLLRGRTGAAVDRTLACAGIDSFLTKLHFSKINRAFSLWRSGLLRWEMLNDRLLVCDHLCDIWKKRTTEMEKCFYIRR